MTTITDLRKGLDARLATIAGLRRFRFAPDRISVPAAAIELSSITYDQTFGNRLHEIPFTVRVYASRATDDAGQDALDAYLAPTGTKSVKAAIEADPTLGGIAETTRVTEVQNYGVYEVSGNPYYGAEFSVTVWARGI